MKPFPLSEISEELLRARNEHPKPFSSAHEAYGIISEEFAEFFDEVRRKSLRTKAAKKELIQVCTTCVRAIEDLDL